MCMWILRKLKMRISKWNNRSTYFSLWCGFRIGYVQMSTNLWVKQCICISFIFSFSYFFFVKIVIIIFVAELKMLLLLLHYYFPRKVWEKKTKLNRFIASRTFQYISFFINCTAAHRVICKWFTLPCANFCHLVVFFALHRSMVVRHPFQLSNTRTEKKNERFSSGNIQLKSNNEHNAKWTRNKISRNFCRQVQLIWECNVIAKKKEIKWIIL